MNLLISLERELANHSAGFSQAVTKLVHWLVIIVKGVTDLEQTRKILNARPEELKPIYFLLGQETYLIEDFLKNLIAKFINPEIRDFMLSYVKAEVEENFAQKISEICKTVSMLAPYRLVIAYCDDKFGNEKEEKALLELFKDFPTGITLFLIAKKAPSKKLESVKLIKQLGEFIEFSPLQKRNLDQWIAKQFSMHKKQVDQNGVNFLKEHFLNNLQQLKSEIEKIITFVGDAETVSADDIKVVVSKDNILKEKIIFDLVDAVGNQQIKKTLLLLENMEKKGEPMLIILKMLIRQFHLIMFSKEMNEKGFPPEDTAKRLKQHPYPIKKCYRQAKNFTQEQLELALARLLHANYQIVTGQYDAKLALQLALIAFKKNCF